MSRDMQIINMKELSSAGLREAAQILTDSLPLGWADFDAAMKEVSLRLVPENTLFAALEEGHVIAWGGILPCYHGRVAELHPLAVRADRRRVGVGTAIVRALEKAAAEKGAFTMWIGADDERTPGETSLAGEDLYDDLPRRMTEFFPGTHQTAFYLKLGYTISGVLPDANGPGKPDIFLAKRLCPVKNNHI